MYHRFIVLCFIAFLSVCSAFAQDSLADSLNMRLEGTWEAPISLPGGVSRCLAVQDTFAYITSGDTFYVINISVPSNPCVVGRLYCHASGVVVCDSLAYTNFGQVIDISVPSNPTPRGTCTGFHLANVAQMSGNYVITNWPELINISDPDSPFVAADYSDLIEICYDAALSDTFLYLAGCHFEGEGPTERDVGEYFCYNISDPDSPVVVAHRDFGMFTWGRYVTCNGDTGYASFSYYYDAEARVYASGCGYQELLGYDSYWDMFYANGMLAIKGGRPEGTMYLSVWNTSNPCSLSLDGYYKKNAKSICAGFISDSFYVFGISGNTLYILHLDTDGIGMLDLPDGNDEDFRIFPNPIMQNSRIVLDKKLLKPQLFDLSGKQVNLVDRTIISSSLSPGIYFLCASYQNKRIVKKIVILG